MIDGPKFDHLFSLCCCFCPKTEEKSRYSKSIAFKCPTRNRCNQSEHDHFSLSMASEAQNVKVVLVGDAAIGRTCLVMTLLTGTFPEMISFAWISWENEMDRRELDHHFSIKFWDTGGTSDFDRLRVLSYAQADIILFCFSLSSICSLDNLDQKFHPEVEHHVPNAHRLLLGLKYAVSRDENLRCYCGGK